MDGALIVLAATKRVFLHGFQYSDSCSNTSLSVSAFINFAGLWYSLTLGCNPPLKKFKVLRRTSVAKKTYGLGLMNENVPVTVA